MRSILFLILFIAEGWFISVSAQSSDQQILEQLDKAISQKEKFKNDREAVISQIKQRLNYATDNTERYKLCGELFNLYLHYQADSACHYIHRKEYYNSLQSQPERDIEISINRAEVRGVMGMYNEALTELQTIHPHELSSPNLEYYYFTIRACYGWMADNTVDPHVKQTYLKKTELYRDSLLKILPQGSDRSIVLAEKMILSGQADQAIPILNKVLTSPLDMQEKHTHTIPFHWHTKPRKTQTWKSITLLRQPSLTSMHRFANTRPFKNLLAWCTSKVTRKGLIIM